MSKQERYFIGLLPPPGLSEQLQAAKKAIAAQFGPSHALKSPPHITLAPPFHAPAAQEAELAAWQDQLVRRWPGFMVHLNGVGHFDERVVYVRVEAAEGLYALQHAIVQGLKTAFGQAASRPYGFTPHLTLAFRDMKPGQFRAIMEWAEKEGFFSAFEARRVALMRHNGLQWEAVAEALLQ